eukprot:Gb_34625 [translate_table: standard]
MGSTAPPAYISIHTPFATPIFHHLIVWWTTSGCNHTSKSSPPPPTESGISVLHPVRSCTCTCTDTYDATEIKFDFYILPCSNTCWMPLPPVLSQHQAGHSIFFFRRYKVIHMKILRDVDPNSGSQMIEINALALANRLWAWQNQNNIEISQGGGHAKISVDSVFVTYMDANNSIYFVTENSFFKIYCYDTLKNSFTTVENFSLEHIDKFQPVALIPIEEKLYLYGIMNVEDIVNVWLYWIYDTRTRMWERDFPKEVPQSVAEFIRGRKKYYCVKGGRRDSWYMHDGDGSDVMLNVQSQSLVSLNNSVPRGYRKMDKASLAGVSTNVSKELYILQKTNIKAACPMHRSNDINSDPDAFCLWKGMIEMYNSLNPNSDNDGVDEEMLVRHHVSPVDGSCHSRAEDIDEDGKQYEPPVVMTGGSQDLLTSEEVAGFRMNWSTVGLPTAPAGRMIIDGHIHS